MKHGGKRKNSGRKPTVPGGKLHKVVLTDEAWREACRMGKQGKGSPSAYIDGLILRPPS